MLDTDALDPAKLPQRESKNDYVDLVRPSHEADDGVWVGQNNVCYGQDSLWYRER